jgi:hypothetical protein
MPSKWLDWTPTRDEFIEKKHTPDPSKPSELGFDGFEGHSPELFPITLDHEDVSQYEVNAIEKAGQSQPSKPSEPSTDSARAHAPDILAALSGRPAACALSCYEIEPGKWIHHPWDGCKTPVQSREPYVPSRADCGCDGPVCSRCFLCPEHCHCRLQHVGPQIGGREIK